MTVAPGVSLATLTPPYSLLESISFSINLLSISRAIHEKGIVHRDLKPENIHINWQNNSNSLANADITVLDFGLAYIERHDKGELISVDDIDFEKVQEEQRQKSYATGAGVVLGNRWYRVPQLRSHGSAQLSDVAKEKLLRARRSPTIDASSVCAILFWLITNVIPEEPEHVTTKTEKKVSSATAESLLLYHQQEENAIIDTVKNTMQATNKGICDWDIDRLSKYLLYTFDRGFADVDDQWLEDQWSVDQLVNHLRYMQFLILSSPLPLSVQSRHPTNFIDDFTPPLNLFIKAKHEFLKNAPRCDWQGDSENCYWTEGWKERRHIDLLTHSKNGVTWTIPVSCSAKLVKIQNKEVMKLFVSSTVNNVDVQLPIHSYETTETIDENKEMIFNRLFKQELCALISIFHGKTIYLTEDTATRAVSLPTDSSR